MSSVVHVAVHASQSPENVRRDLLASLRARRANHKFHYDSVKQTQKWLAVHQVYSPSRNDADCAATYDRAFTAAVAKIRSGPIHLLGLGCGGGQKDTRLLKLLRSVDDEVFYTPCDVALAMVLVARQTALPVIPSELIFPLVCDLGTADDLPAVLTQGLAASAPRLISFFGMIPNFEPDEVLPKLAQLVRPSDWLLFSANLAPGADYAAGVKQILPQYANPITAEWLVTFLLDLGVERSDGEVLFRIEEVPATSLLRVIADFHFSRRRVIKIEDERFEFEVGDIFRLFFSYRYTSERVRAALEKYGFEVCDQWRTQSEEEAILLCRRKK